MSNKCNSKFNNEHTNNDDNQNFNMIESDFNPQIAVNAISNNHSVNSNNTQHFSEINNEIRSKKINTDNRYRALDTGPFQVYVEHKFLNIGRLHPMKVGQLLNELENEIQSQIEEVKPVGRNRVRISVKSPSAANLLVVHNVFQKNDLIAYIPEHLTCKKAIVRHVDTSLGEEYLKQNIQSSFQILNVKRLMRKIKDKDETLTVPREMIAVTFRGLILPEHIYINRVRCSVEP